MKLQNIIRAGAAVLAAGAICAALALPGASEEEDTVDTLISDCKSGWHCDGGARYSSYAEGTDGNAAARADFTANCFFFYVASGTFDLTGAHYIEMDLYVSDPDTFRNATDCRMDIGPDANVDAWNVKLTGSALRGMELNEGWNHVILPITGIDTANYDLQTARVIRFYAIGLSDDERVMMVDNVHAVSDQPDDGLPKEAERVTKYKKYTFSATVRRQEEDPVLQLGILGGTK